MGTLKIAKCTHRDRLGTKRIHTKFGSRGSKGKKLARLFATWLSYLQCPFAILSQPCDFISFSACNVLMTEEKRLFTLSNRGEARNCSLTAVLNPPNLKIQYFQIGDTPSHTGLISPVSIVVTFDFHSPN